MYFCKQCTHSAFSSNCSPTPLNIPDPQCSITFPFKYFNCIYLGIMWEFTSYSPTHSKLFISAVDVVTYKSLEGCRSTIEKCPVEVSQACCVLHDAEMPISLFGGGMEKKANELLLPCWFFFFSPPRLIARRSHFQQ